MYFHIQEVLSCGSAGVGLYFWEAPGWSGRVHMYGIDTSQSAAFIVLVYRNRQVFPITWAGRIHDYWKNLKNWILTVLGYINLLLHWFVPCHAEVFNVENRERIMWLSTRFEQECHVLFFALEYISLIMRKPVFGVCDHVRLKPACSAAETSRVLEFGFSK